jgi:hypothetical protein
MLSNCFDIGASFARVTVIREEAMQNFKQILVLESLALLNSG